MTTIWIAILSLAALGAIFLTHYLRLEKGISLGSIFFRKKNVVHIAKEPDSAEVTVEEMIPSQDKVDPKNVARADSLVKRAEAQLTKGQAREAEKLLIQALSLDPGAVEAYNKLGLIYLREGQFNKAENIFRKLIVAAIGEPSYFSNLGLALYSQGKLEEAKTHYKKAIELDGGRAGRFFSLGQIHRELGEMNEAVGHLKKAVEMEPRNLDFMLSLAQFHIEVKQLPEARQLLGKILLIAPDNGDALSMLKNTEEEGQGKDEKEVKS
jgi:tetratricopeptide (TPR) repeat protein